MIVDIEREVDQEMIADPETWRKVDALTVAREATWKEIALIWEEGALRSPDPDPTAEVAKSSEEMGESIAGAIVRQGAEEETTTEERARAGRAAERKEEATASTRRSQESERKLDKMITRIKLLKEDFKTQNQISQLLLKAWQPRSISSIRCTQTMS